MDACHGHVSPLTGDPIMVVAAGGIFDSRGLAMALSMGASGKQVLKPVSSFDWLQFVLRCLGWNEICCL